MKIRDVYAYLKLLDENALKKLISDRLDGAIADTEHESSTANKSEEKILEKYLTIQNTIDIMTNYLGIEKISVYNEKRFANDKKYLPTILVNVCFSLFSCYYGKFPQYSKLYPNEDFIKHIAESAIPFAKLLHLMNIIDYGIVQPKEED